ncbi:adenylosuccinate lyase [Crassaminicella thermophila]|uniref:Adenylosuccinate lyase n=1 Tax=Crassaminicella thermophila TaxID=2599308 RepID=A0A5C0SDN9_CRATE|nr:adenylosuccinate lyase [Crassaminicella thermophila]QEK12210.1 adenylosuccinate lyase [Crassaminicella thermophila]
MAKVYENPLITRYASKEMAEIFSSDEKFKTWRKLWIALAESQKELGLEISDEQIDEMKKFCDNINYDVAIAREKETRHDVMSHVYAFGVQCPKAKPIIHLGATSAYVGDNTDIIIIKKAMTIIRKKTINLMNKLSKFAKEYKDLPTLGFTHFQPAQLTTVGKRATLWLMDLLMDFEDIENLLLNIKLRGVKGTTGTQASFLKLFDENHEKVKELDKLVAKKLGFDKTFPVTGQTYSRKLDYKVHSVLSGIAQSLHKMTNDIRLLQHLKEVEEPFEANQIGSSAMAYKRNPMRSERVASLARYVIASSMNTAMTTSTQWFERTLDDSANKRISIPEAFLAVDAILDICINISSGLVVYEKVIQQHVMNELPFMATENILMEAVKRGGDRQELHEKIRVHSMEAAKVVKQEGKANDLLIRIANDETFGLSKEDINNLTNPKLFIGRASEQVSEFIEAHIDPIIESNKELLGIEVDLKV